MFSLSILKNHLKLIIFFVVQEVKNVKVVYPRKKIKRNDGQSEFNNNNNNKLVFWFSFRTFLYMCVCMCVCIYIYIYIYTALQKFGNTPGKVWIWTPLSVQNYHKLKRIHANIVQNPTFLGVSKLLEGSVYIYIYIYIYILYLYVLYLYI